MTVTAIIVAAGSGVRAGGELPKQYQHIGGKPVLRWTVEAFLNHPSITYVGVVIGEGHEALYKAATKGLKLMPPILGGDSRQSSCRLGVEACAALKPAKILIHDAARPFVSGDVINAVIDGLDQDDAVIPGVAVADTIKFAPKRVIEKTVDRDGMWFVQTPQGFHYSKILEAHKQAKRDGQNGLTDDAAVAEYAGLKVKVVQGAKSNIKLTTAEDITLANQTLSATEYSKRPDVRAAQGIDFHTFDEGNEVILCGVAIPYSKKLKGHSDADAALHALCDAIFGGLGEGDIGVHFPPSDMTWKNADSSIFVEKAMSLLHARDGIVANADITILAEAPKISPHIAAMKSNLAKLLHITADRVAIKATTTEKMGAIGRNEGIAAFATVTIRLPL